MMDFFESLEERTVDVMHSEAWATRYRKEVREYGADKSDVLVHLTIEATIEALKEMMVGEPIRARLHHWQWTCGMCASIAETTMRISKKDLVGERDDTLVHLAYEFIGTDGEEVVVMVFRDDKGRKV